MRQALEPGVTRPALLLGVAAMLLAACGNADEPIGAPAGPVAVQSTVVAPFRFTREYVFVSAGDGAPVLAPFAMVATDDGERLHRRWYGWLARGAQWDRFLDDSRVTSRLGGVWRVLPTNEMRVIASGPSEVESLHYQQGERRLRMVLGDARSEWNQGGDNRFRILDGTLSVGAETTEGMIFEMLRVERTESDGWPASHEVDAAFLTSGDSLQLLMSDAPAEDDASFTWVRTPIEDRTLPGGEVAWLEVEPLEDARRDIPISWTLANEAVGLTGELRAIGRDVILGPERGGRRAVEIRYSVEGSIEVSGETWPVTGTIRHGQQ
jgi:hypothetical protein